jgi:hypothetical protein
VAYNGAYAGYIFRVRNGAWTMLSYGTIDASAVKGDGTDVVRFETDWTSLQLFFNDSKVTEATDADPALGSGVSGLWGGPNFTLDNFGVKPLT